MPQTAIHKTQSNLKIPYHTLRSGGKWDVGLEYMRFTCTLGEVREGQEVSLVLQSRFVMTTIGQVSRTRWLLLHSLGVHY